MTGLGHEDPDLRPQSGCHTCGVAPQIGFKSIQGSLPRITRECNYGEYESVNPPQCSAIPPCAASSRPIALLWLSTTLITSSEMYLGAVTTVVVPGLCQTAYAGPVR